MNFKWSLPFLAVSLLLVAPCHAQKNVVDMLPNALHFLAPPPLGNSADFARDKALYEQTRSLKGSARWEQAIFDADIENNSPFWFNETINLDLSKEKAPAFYAMLEMLFTNLNAVEHPAKDHYMRTRPFVAYNDIGATCAPGDEKSLSTNGSYPSGHTSRGWGMALVLAEIVPEHQDAIFQRGWELGQSRVICGFHWQSDVDAGRLVAAATVARLHNEPQFIDLLEKTKAEVKKLQAQKK